MIEIILIIPDILLLSYFKPLSKKQIVSNNIMILIIQYFSYNLVCRRKIVSKHSDARQQWMIDSNQTKTKMNDHTSGGKNLYIYIFFFFKESFTIYHGYGLLEKFSDIFQSYIAINQQRVTCLELARIFRLRLRTSQLLSVILYRINLLPLVDYHLVQYPQHSFEKNIHLLFG